MTFPLWLQWLAALACGLLTYAAAGTLLDAWLGEPCDDVAPPSDVGVQWQQERGGREWRSN